MNVYASGGPPNFVGAAPSSGQASGASPPLPAPAPVQGSNPVAGALDSFVPSPAPAEAPKILEYGHEYVMHGWEGLNSAVELAAAGAIGLAATKKGVPMGNALGSVKGATATFMGVSGGVQAAVALAVTADAARRKDWAQVADGTSHIGEGGAQAAAAMKIARAPAGQVMKSVLESKTIAALGTLGAVGHAFHNTKEAKESGHRLKWLSVAGDIASAAGGAAWMAMKHPTPAVMGVAAGGMLVDIASGYIDQAIHRGEHHNNEAAGDPVAKTQGAKDSQKVI